MVELEGKDSTGGGDPGGGRDEPGWTGNLTRTNL